MKKIILALVVLIIGGGVYWWTSKDHTIDLGGLTTTRVDQTTASFLNSITQATEATFETPVATTITLKDGTSYRAVEVTAEEKTKGEFTDVFFEKLEKGLKDAGYVRDYANDADNVRVSSVVFKKGEAVCVETVSVKDQPEVKYMTSLACSN
jgi:hypothetical protein